MSFKISKRRIPWALLFIFLNSCSNPCYQWDCIKICSNCGSNSKVSTQCESYNGIGVDIVNGKEGLRVYLNTYLLPFPCCDGNPDLMPITITANQTTKDFIVYRFEGGQRALLTVEAADMVLDALLINESVTISTSILKTELVSDNFIPCMIKAK